MKLRNIWFKEVINNNKKPLFLILMITTVCVSFGVQSDLVSQNIISQTDLRSSVDLEIDIGIDNKNVGDVDHNIEIYYEYISNSFEQYEMPINNICYIYSLKSYFHEERKNNSMEALADQRSLQSYIFVINDSEWELLNLNTNSSVIYGVLDNYIRNINDTFYLSIQNNLDITFHANESSEVSWTSLNQILDSREINLSSQGFIFLKYSKFFDNYFNNKVIDAYPINLHVSIFFDYLRFEYSNFNNYQRRMNYVISEIYIYFEKNDSFKEVNVVNTYDQKIQIFGNMYFENIKLFVITVNLLIFILSSFLANEIFSLNCKTDILSQKLILLGHSKRSTFFAKILVFLFSILLLAISYYLLNNILIKLYSVYMNLFFINYFMKIAIILILFNTSLHLIRFYFSEIKVFLTLLFLFGISHIFIQTGINDEILGLNLYFLIKQSSSLFILLAICLYAISITDNYLIIQNSKFLKIAPLEFKIILPTINKKIMGKYIFTIFIALLLIGTLYTTQIEIEEKQIEYNLGGDYVVSGFNTLNDTNNWISTNHIQNYTIKGQASLYLVINGRSIEINLQGINITNYSSFVNLDDISQKLLNRFKEFGDIAVNKQYVSKNNLVINDDILIENSIKTKKISTKLVETFEFWPAFIPLMQNDETNGPYIITSLDEFNQIINFTNEVTNLKYTIIGDSTLEKIYVDDNNIHYSSKIQIIKNDNMINTLIKLERLSFISFLCSLFVIVGFLNLNYTNNLSKIAIKMYIEGFNHKTIKKSMNNSLFILIVYYQIVAFFILYFITLQFINKLYLTHKTFFTTNILHDWFKIIIGILCLNISIFILSYFNSRRKISLE